MNCPKCEAKPKTKPGLAWHLLVVHGVVRGLVVALLVFSTIGCTQLKKLTGSEDKKDTANLAGYWRAPITAGATILLVGQNGQELAGTSYTDGGQGIHGTISGHVDGSGFAITIDEGTRCTQKISINGEERGGQLLVTVTAAGNDIPGTTCYPQPINVTTTFTRN